ncbi:hypothetical protein [uncultured Xanthomonas sp.]|uniref:hypothetical protein n=1 Tax=uncultured Xanthomonas sp. TaxID=152831 RepID=UPI0025F43E99|nr:hypothetical protein [uncultured Xanthomonas sp.]
MDLRDRPHNAFPGFTVSTTPELIGMRRTRAAATWISVRPGRERGFLPGHVAPTHRSRPDATEAGQARAVVMHTTLGSSWNSGHTAFYASVQCKDGDATPRAIRDKGNCGAQTRQQWNARPASHAPGCAARPGTIG